WDLERDFAAQNGVPGQKDDAETAAAQLPDQTKLSKTGILDHRLVKKPLRLQETHQLGSRLGTAVTPITLAAIRARGRRAQLFGAVSRRVVSGVHQRLALRERREINGEQILLEFVV